MKRYIEVSDENRDFLVRAFGVTRPMVSMSLNYMRSSALGAKIRHLAIERGGVRMVSLPEFETIHDANGMMTQTFPNGARLEFNKSDGSVTVVWNDKAICRYDNPQVSKIREIQDLAASIK